MKPPVHLVQMGLIFHCATLGLFAQAESPSGSSQLTATATTAQAFSTEQSELARQELKLESQGATPAQLKAWRRQNAAALVLQQQRLVALAVANNALPQKESFKPFIPAGASANLTALLTTQAALSNARAHIHNQLLQQAKASGANLNLTQMTALESQAGKLFLQKYSAQMNRLAQLSQAVVNEAVQTTRRVPPATVVSPPNASPQLVANLTARRQLRISRIELMNQYANATPAERTAALRAWDAAHATQIVQLQQKAADLTQLTAATTGTN